MLSRIKEPSSWAGLGAVAFALDMITSDMAQEAGRTVADAALMGAKGNWVGAGLLAFGGLLSIILPERKG